MNWYNSQHDPDFLIDFSINLTILVWECIFHSQMLFWTWNFNFQKLNILTISYTIIISNHSTTLSCQFLIVSTVSNPSFIIYILNIYFLIFYSNRIYQFVYCFVFVKYLIILFITLSILRYKPICSIKFSHQSNAPIRFLLSPAFFPLHQSFVSSLLTSHHIISILEFQLYSITGHKIKAPNSHIHAATHYAQFIWLEKTD